MKQNISVKYLAMGWVTEVTFPEMARIFLFTAASRLAPDLIQPPI
jgi:hypothetical protein